LAISSELDRLCVVLVSTRNPLNIGAAARAMSNLGFPRLRLVHPYEASFREARSAVGAAPLLRSAEEYKSVEEAVADCSLVIGTTAGRNRELRQPLKLLAEAAPVIRKRLRSERVALLFGSEKRGLSNADLSHCHWLLRIPTQEEHISMNLGQAVAICLYELARGTGERRKKTKAQRAPQAPHRTKAPRSKAQSAAAGELERITSMLLDALQASGYLGERPVAAKQEKVRRMVRRLALSPEDAEVWLGMLRQILWKLENPL
jgi:TrmH family RNA methyltransferase